jgi:outer membrane protein TolC
VKAGEPLSLAEAVALALRFNETVRFARADLERATGQVGEAMAPLKPAVAISSTNSYQTDYQVLHLGKNSIDVTQRQNNQFALSLQFDPDISGTLRAGASQAQFLRRASVSSLAAAVNNTVNSTIAAYCNLLLAAKNLSVDQANVDRAQEALRTTLERRKSGVAPGNEEAQERSDLASAEDALISDQGVLERQRLAFLTTLGLQPSTQPIAVLPLPELEPAPSADGLVEEALRQRPEVEGARLELLAAQQGLKVARTSSAPSLVASLSGIYDPHPAGISGINRNAVAQLTLSVPLYDRGLARSKMAEARADIDRANERFRQTRDQVTSDVAFSLSEVTEALSHQQAAVARVKSAGESLRLSLERYKQGLAHGYLEVSTARESLYDAERGQASADIQLFTARADLQRALGAYAGGEKGLK